MEENKQKENNQEENKNIADMYIDIFETYKELNSIKRVIKDHIKYENGELSFESTYTFTEDLLKLIKYTDVEFYDSLKK